VDDDKIATIYVYLDYKQQSQQTPLMLMSTLLKQLIQRRTTNLDNVKVMYQRHENRHTRPTLDDIVEILEVEISKHSKVFAIVDGLDELPEEDGARSEFLTAVKSLAGPINLLVTSRDLPSILLYFEEATHLTIHADDNDVRRYVGRRIPLWYPRNLRQTVVDKIACSTAGM
jgi:hypothetical protein